MSKKSIKLNESLSKKIEKIEKENQPALYEQGLDKDVEYEKTKAELNQNILEITMTIRDKYPELSRFIEEMSVTIPNEKIPKITLTDLNTYYNSLKESLSKYILEHPEKTKE